MKKQKHHLLFFLLIIMAIYALAASFLWKDHIAWRIGYLEDVSLENSDSSLWEGKAKLVLSKVKEIIIMSRKIEVYHNILPIRIKVEKLPDTLDGYTTSRWDKSSITLNSLKMKDGNLYIDNTLIHEIAHLLKWDSDDKHSREWVKMCNALFVGMFSEELKVSARPYPCRAHK